MEVLKRAFFLIYNRKVAQQRVQVCGRKQTGEQALQLEGTDKGQDAHVILLNGFLEAVHSA